MGDRRWWGGSKFVPLTGDGGPKGVPQEQTSGLVQRSNPHPEPQKIGNRNTWGAPTIRRTAGQDEPGISGGFMTHAPRKGKVWGLPTMYNTTAPTHLSDVSYTGGDPRSEHFNDGAAAAGNDRFNEVIRNTVNDSRNLTFPEPPGRD